MYTLTIMYIKRIAEEKITQLLNQPKIIILLGPRQTGKTTLIKKILENHQGIILNLDIEIDKERVLLLSHLSPEEAFKNLGNPKILVIDEAQRLPAIGKIVKGWYDFGIKTKIILLGSSTLDLLDKSAEPLTGRNQKLFLPPLLLSEILKTQAWYSPTIAPKLLIEKMKPTIEAIIQERLIFGSYPEAVTTDQKENYLLNLVSDYLLKDIFQFNLIRSSEVVKKLLILLAYQIGSTVSLSELATNLGISRITVEKYLDLLERSFVIFRLSPFSSNLRKEIVKSTKIYFWDNGVRNALIKDFNLTTLRNDIGQLWENWVIAEFAKKNLFEGNPHNLYFWRTMNKSEVDLVIKGTNIFQAFEIKWSKKRSIKNKAFTRRYQIPVNIICKENFIEFLLK